MTKRESAIVSAYTGFLCGSFSDLHEYAEHLMERPVFSHEFGGKDFAELLKFKAKEDFISMEIK